MFVNLFYFRKRCAILEYFVIPPIVHRVADVESPTNSTDPSADDPDRNKVVYIGLVGGVFLFCFVRNVFLGFLCTYAGQNLHNRMFQKVLRAPVRFFEVNPVGE